MIVLESGAEMAKSKDSVFSQVARYKVIYVFSIPDRAHRGLLKVGDASLESDKPIDQLPPNSSELNRAARERIDSYTNTAGIAYTLEYTELAVAVEFDSGRLRAFRDHEVHNVLENSGYPRKQIDGTTGREWFDIDLTCAKAAIAAVKNGMANMSGTNTGARRIPIVFREEQLDAIESTVKRFKKHDRYLWNAKMRFGKTLSALEVVKRCEFSKTIIMTHRPVVDAGWYEDFKKVFAPEDGYLYGSHGTGYSLEQLCSSGKKFIYFASIQDLRGSKRVDGKHEKNDEVFDTHWDLVIVDEAHEGTTTALGNRTVNEVFKEGSGSKFLALSGTAFNIISDYSDEDVYTWDYIMEQEMKAKWDSEHFGDHNPYSDLPEMRIFTYDLGEVFKGTGYLSTEDRAFNFREFFRTWTGDAKVDHAVMPPTASEGDFVHESDVKSFLNLLTKDSDGSAYPFSTEEYRELFKHTFWLLPGVKEALALQRLLESHPVFGNGAFDIINVAGDGDPDDPKGETLAKVKARIAAAGRFGYTITLSCGKLTTGVTVPEWTGCFMLAGSYSTSASAYLQTIFRVQSPYRDLNGKIKETCYVFDFAPDRTLKMVSRAASISSKAGKTSQSDRQILGKFLNFCPVIAVQGSQMRELSAHKLLQELKRAYAERAVRNGFADTSLYNDELLKLDEADIRDFENLKKIIGSNKATRLTDGVTVNDQGLTEEEYEQLEKLKKKPKKELTEEEKKRLEELKKAKDGRRKAISILMQISVRMPLLIFGADIPHDEEITLERFVDLVDDSSWEEFMPTGVDKHEFRKFMKYYDEEVFIAAGNYIRNQAIYADTLAPTDRVKKIAALHATFKNPDKETVLTPWRIVNLHMSLQLGGYCFWDEKFESPLAEGVEPYFVDKGDVTSSVFSNTSQLLEINSKTGLYPLYLAYTLFRNRMGDSYQSSDAAEQLKVWKDVVRDNLFIICKTPMAKAITIRTLLGYSKSKVNAHYFDDLVNTIQNKPQQFIEKIKKPSYWKRNEKTMKFNAVVGNPPYQEETAKHKSLTNGQARRKSVFQYFQTAADSATSGVTSLIYPGGRWIHRSGKGMNKFGLAQINDPRLARIDFYADANEIFPDVAIADGISIVLKNRHKSQPGFTYVYHGGGDEVTAELDCPGEELIPLDPRDSGITQKVESFVAANNLRYLHDRILSQKLFGVESDFVECNPDKVRLLSEDSEIDFEHEIKLLTNDRAGKAGRAKWYITEREVICQNAALIDEWQVIVSSANAGGQKRDNQIEIVDNHSAFGRARVALGTFKSKEEAENFYAFATAPLIKFMFLMTDENLTSLGKRVPDLINYSASSSLVDFSGNLNGQLYSLVGLTSEEIEYVEKTANRR